MPQEIEVDGEIVEFPDDMSDAEIEAALVADTRQPPTGDIPIDPLTLLDTTRGVGEVGLQLGTAALAQGPAGLAGIGASLIPGGKTGPEAIEDVMSALTFRPRGEAGQAISHGVGKGGEIIDQGLDDISFALSGGNPLIAAQAKANIIGSTLLLGGGSAPLRAASTVGRAARSAPRPPPIPPTVPSTGELFAQGGAAFERARASGSQISTGSAGGLKSNLSNLTDAKGVRATPDSILHPDSTAALNHINKRLEAGSVGFEDLVEMRQVAADAAGATKPADARIGRILRDKIDDYVDSLSPDDVTGGDPRVAASSLKEARELWTRARKAEVIDDMFENAKTTAGANFTRSGLENALRGEFKRLAKNKKRMRAFNAAEKTAILAVARGGPLVNALRLFGKFAPTGLLPAVLGSGAGAALLGPFGAIAVPAAGAAARAGATNLTLGSAKAVSDLVRRGP